MALLTTEQLNTMGKNELISHIINTCEANQIDWATAYGSLTRKKVAELRDIAIEIDPGMHNGDVLDKQDDWEYEKPNKANWQEARDVEEQPPMQETLEGFEDVELVEAAPEVKKAKEPKAKKEKAPKEPKAPRQRTYSAEQIMEMIHLVEEAKWKKSAVAEKFECSGTFVHNVVVGNVYRDITGRGKKSE